MLTENGTRRVECQQRIAQHCGANQHTAGQAFGQRVTKR
jgi:hypothetical protein